MKTLRITQEQKQFYRRLLLIAIPIIIQNAITNFVNLLDNIMVGQIGTNPMSGVSIVNQLMFVFNLTLFGACSGAGIFTAQYYGQGNHEGVRHTFRFKLLTMMGLCVLALILLSTAGEDLVLLYIHAGEEAESALQTLNSAMAYLAMMLPGLIPFTLSQCYASTLRESDDALLPMIAGITAVIVNLVFNYLLIFGHLFFPRMGVTGAALATVLSRFVECLIILIYTHTHKKRHPFIEGAYKSLAIRKELAVSILKKGSPLLLNELLWSWGTTFLVQIYSRRGLMVVASLNIAQTITNVFNVVFLSMGSAVAIIIGQELGRRDKNVYRDAKRLTWFSVSTCLLIGSALYLSAPLFPSFYNTEEPVRILAASMIRVSAVCMPFYAFANATYFILRSGGRTLITFLFDSGFVWLISVPVAALLIRSPNLSMTMVYLLVNFLELVKCFFGNALVRRRVWIRDITV